MRLMLPTPRSSLLEERINCITTKAAKAAMCTPPPQHTHLEFEWCAACQRLGFRSCPLHSTHQPSPSDAAAQHLHLPRFTQHQRWAVVLQQGCLGPLLLLLLFLVEGRPGLLTAGTSKAAGQQSALS